MVDYKEYIHENDLKAYEALTKIPGFATLTKSFTKLFGERIWKIECMSSGIKLSEKQMGDVYALLGPICEKLGIKEPELYVVLDRDPNAYTIGIDNPIICLHSGLIETCSKEQIQTTLAHECGHIACHHVLLGTMARVLFTASTGLLNLWNIGKFLSTPLLLGLSYWSRCAELSADRAAAVVMRNGEPVAKLMGVFSGMTNNLKEKMNFEEYLKQEKEYEQYLKESNWNKFLEFWSYADMEHPLNITRAKEILKWQETEQFKNILSK